jgi:hypothetical protein
MPNLKVFNLLRRIRGITAWMNERLRENFISNLSITQKDEVCSGRHEIILGCPHSSNQNRPLRWSEMIDYIKQSRQLWRILEGWQVGIFKDKECKKLFNLDKCLDCEDGSRTNSNLSLIRKAATWEVKRTSWVWYNDLSIDAGSLFLCEMNLDFNAGSFQPRFSRILFGNKMMIISRLI